MYAQGPFSRKRSDIMRGETNTISIGCMPLGEANATRHYLRFANS